MAAATATAGAAAGQLGAAPSVRGVVVLAACCETRAHHPHTHRGGTRLMCAAARRRGAALPTAARGGGGAAATPAERATLPAFCCRGGMRCSIRSCWALRRCWAGEARHAQMRAQQPAVAATRQRWSLSPTLHRGTRCSGLRAGSRHAHARAHAGRAHAPMMRGRARIARGARPMTLHPPLRRRWTRRVQTACSRTLPRRARAWE